MGRFSLASGAGTDGEHDIDCFEHSLNLEQALELILTYHRPRQGWNDFVRICLALTLKSGFQQKAFANMRAGGTNKGFTSLLKADRINVCREIAKLAGTGSTNAGEVETILRKAHPSIIAALHEENRTERKILQEFSPGHPSAYTLFGGGRGEECTATTARAL